MDLTRRDLIKSLSVLPFLGFAPLTKQKQGKTYDYSNFRKMFTEVNFDDYPNGMITFDVFNPSHCITFSKPYEINGCYYTDVKQGTHDYTDLAVPLSKEVKITDEEYMKTVVCFAVDRNMVVFDSEARGYSDKLSELMVNCLYDNHTLYSNNRYYRYVRFPFDESEIIHFDDNMMDFAINQLGAGLGKKCTRFCVGVRGGGNFSDGSLPFYSFKYGDYRGMAILDNKDMILGMY